MNLLKLAAGWLSLLPAAWMTLLWTAAFAWAAASSYAGDTEAIVYRTLAWIEAALALLIVWATWYDRTHTTRGV